jgi:hypothetical protein
MKLSGISSTLMWSNILKIQHIKRIHPVQQRQDSRKVTLCQVYNLREMVVRNCVRPARRVTLAEE